MYRVDIYTDGGPRQTIYNYLDNDYLLKAGTLEKAVDAIDEFKFDMIHHHLIIDTFKTLIEIIDQKKNKVVFRGRVLLPSNQMGEDGVYDCDYTAEGAMAYLHDSYPNYGTYTDYTPQQYLSSMLYKHNAVVEPYKQLKLGVVNFTKKTEVSTDPSYDTTRYSYVTPEKSTMDHIREDGVNRWGGEIYARYEADGTYIDWLDEPTEVKTTELRIGRNIKSIKRTIDPLDVITRLIPLGAAEVNQYNQQARITIADINGGKNYIDIPELIEIYGIQTGTEVFDDMASPELVLQAGREKVAEIRKQVAEVQFDVNLLDLSTIDLEPDEIERGNKHRCYAAELGINGEVLRIVATTEDIMNPQNKNIRIGEKQLSLAEYQKQSAKEIVKVEAPVIIDQKVPKIIVEKVPPMIKEETEKTLGTVRQEFDESYEAQKADINNAYNNAVAEAQAKVVASEQKMTSEINNAKSTLSTDITSSYNNAVAAAETKAKEMDAVISGELTSAKSQLNTSITNSYNNAVSAAQTKVSEAEARLNTAINNQKVILTTDINNSYTKAVTDAEKKAKVLDAAVSQEIVNAKAALSTDITNSYNNAVATAEAKAKALDASINQMVSENKQAADTAIGNLNTALSSTNNKVGTIEQNVTAAQANISTLQTTTGNQQTAINQAKQDISGLTTTVSGHTSDISTLNNQIVLKASKTEVTDAVNGLVIGGVNLLRDSQNFESAKFIQYSGATITSNTKQSDGYYRIVTANGTSNIKLLYYISQLKVEYANKQVTLSFDLINNSQKPLVLGHNWAGNIYVTIPVGYNGRYSYTGVVNSSVTGHLQFRTVDIADGLDFSIRNIQAELGTKATAYDISPLDRDALISQNAAAITVANNEITKRVTKTEYDTRTGEIEQIANTAKSTADTNTQTITTVKGSVDALSQWKADKGTAIDQTINSVSTKAWLTDISPIDGRLQTAEANITTNANEIQKRVTKTTYDADTKRIEGTANTAKSTADSNSSAITTVSGRVGSLEQWKTDKGSKIDQTIDAVTTKVWSNDIDKLSYVNENLLLNSKSIFTSTVTGYDSAIKRTFNSDTGVFRIDVIQDASYVNAYTYIESYISDDKFFVNVANGESYTLSFDIRGSSLTGRGQVRVDTRTPDSSIFSSGNLESVDGMWQRRKSLLQAPVRSAQSKSMLMFSGDNVKAGDWFELKNFKLEKGTKGTPYAPNYKDAENKITEVKQTADGALTKATNIGNDYVKQSAVLVQPDGVLIGSKKVSGTEMASAISVTPSNVDIITKVMRVTGDMAVAGDIKSLSLSAVNADIANLRANILTADSVTATALKADTALITKLNTNALLTNYLTADTAMINSIKTNAITAVRADVAWLKANIITADSITSTALKVDTALMDKLNTNSILTKTLVADSVLTDTIKTKSLDAVYADIATLKSRVITAGSITADALNVDAAMINKLNTNSILTKTITADTVLTDAIKTKSLEAVNADIANLKAKIITADSIDAKALKVDVALMDKLNANSILTNKLLADTAMINAIKSNSITATRGDIAWLKSNIITADSITSTAIKSELATIDKLFATSALVNQLTGKQAFIDSINAISVTANSVLINSVKGELGKPNSGLNIRRPDGALWVENGMGRNEMVVTGCLPRFSSTSSAGFGAGVWENGEWLVTTRSKAGNDYVRIDALYFNHDYRYLTIYYGVKAEKTGVFVRVEEFGVPTGVTPFSAYKGYTASIGSGTTYDSFVIDLGTPTYKRRQFYLYMKPNAEGTVDDLAFARFLPMRLNG